MARPTKQQILDLIQHHASENGGVPLGRKRFEAATGITEAEWIGVYWARWSAAIEEAGFAPNSFQGAIAEDVLLEHLARVVADLGRFPTAPELRLRRKSDPTLPNDKVFQRLGSKPERIRRLREFCAERPEYSAVAAICESLVVEPTADDPHDLNAPIPGFVYMVKSGTRYKVGRTGELQRRVSELKYQSPDEVELVHSIRTDDQIGIEAYWKRRFAPRQHREEWYTLTAADVRAFKRRKGFM